MALPLFYETEVINKKVFPNDVVLLELKLQEKLDFKAGQFVLVYVTIDGKDENRAFSIASKPSQDTIELLIKKYDHGKVSPLLFDLNSGDKLKIRGPFGVFTVKQPEKEEIVYIASGTGIAPLRSMINEVLEQNPSKKVTLILGFRHEEDNFYKEEFENLQEKHDNFKLHLCATKPKEAWNHATCRVTEIVPKLIPNPENKDVYICGPNQMINDTLNILIKDLNFQKDRVHIERWGTK